MKLVLHAELGAVAACCLLLTSHGAMAAPCGRPDVDATFPPDGAGSVPPNAVLTAHYGSPAVYAEELVSLTDESGASVGLRVSYDASTSLLRAVPERPLTSGKHELSWPGLRGVSAAGGLGRGRTLTFTTGTAVDSAPPSFEGLSGVRWDLARERDPCLDRLDDRFVFELDLGRASDDSSVELLSVVLFETRDPGAPGQQEPLQLGVRAWPADARVELRRPASDAGKTCFAAVVQDLLGNVSGGGEREVCVSTERPPFFDGCALSRIGTPSQGHGLAVPLLGWLWLGRRRARHASRRRRA